MPFIFEIDIYELNRLQFFMGKGLISQESIEQIRAAAKIDEVIQDFVTLTPTAGGELLGVCPFHDDHDPSMRVHPVKGYYCFVCGSGGKAIKFLQELHKGWSFRDVMEYLASKYGIELRFQDVEDDRQYQILQEGRRQLSAVMERALRFFEDALFQPGGEEALEYLRSRGYSDEEIKKDRLGYAPLSRSRLSSQMASEKHSVDTLVKAGLAAFYPDRETGQQVLRDVFVHRIMIPILDKSGKVVAFGGRRLSDNEKYPKYQNSPESVYSKRTTLYGIDRAARAISRRNAALIVEGYFDVMAPRRYGVDHVVAPCGTALTPEQIRLILSCMTGSSKTIYLGFDSDAAGIKATHASIEKMREMIYQGRVNVKVIDYRDAKDPDEFILKYGVEEFEILFEDATNCIEWELRQFLKGKNLDDGGDFAQALAYVSDTLIKIPDMSLRSFYLSVMAEILCRGDVRMTQELSADLRMRVKGYGWKPKANRATRQSLEVREQAERDLVMIFLHCPNYRQLIRERLLAGEIQFDSQSYRAWWKELETRNINDSDMIGTLETEFCQRAEEKNNLDFKPFLFPNERDQIMIGNPGVAVENALLNLELIIAQQRLSQLREERDKPIESALYQKLSEDIAAEEEYIQSIQERISRL